MKVVNIANNHEEAFEEYERESLLLMESVMQEEILQSERSVGRSWLKKEKKKLLKYLVKECPSHKIRVLLLRKCNYYIGGEVFIGRDLIITDDEIGGLPNLVIGDRVAISPRVTLVLEASPYLSRVAASCCSKKGKIIIEKDAWIGTGSVILPNVRIGECGIVGANSLVIKDVLPYTVVGGVPARKLKKLDIPFEGKISSAKSI
jgi:acetyltransferase-like isoleucine patch superfamily enzyme